MGVDHMTGEVANQIASSGLTKTAQSYKWTLQARIFVVAVTLKCQSVYEMDKSRSKRCFVVVGHGCAIVATTAASSLLYFSSLLFFPLPPPSRGRRAGGAGVRLRGWET